MSRKKKPLWRLGIACGFEVQLRIGARHLSEHLLAMYPVCTIYKEGKKGRYPFVLPCRTSRDCFTGPAWRCNTYAILFPMSKSYPALYKKLYAHFGPQHWWPGETPLEVCVGAVLTQNTSWQNVERAIANIKNNGRLDLREILAVPEKKLAQLIRPSGYFNLKAKRLRSLLKFLEGADGGDWESFMKKEKLENARRKLLEVYGVGPETADSILLYAAGRKTFVIDRYTIRFGARYGLFPVDTDYETARSFFMENLPKSAKLYNEYHALLVALGKNYCKPKPACEKCPLRRGCDFVRGVTR